MTKKEYLQKAYNMASIFNYAQGVKMTLPQSGWKKEFERYQRALDKIRIIFDTTLAQLQEKSIDE